MKISLFPTLLLIITTTAIGYLTYDIAHGHFDSNDMIVGIGTGISVLLTLGCLLGLSLKDKRLNMNMKAWSCVAFIIVAFANVCFAVFGVVMPFYVIVLALLLVVHLWVIHKLVVEQKKFNR